LQHGITRKNFERLVPIYQRCRERLKVPKKAIITCEAQEDETAIQPDTVWCPKRDVLDGVCGLKGAGHKCDMRFKVYVGDHEGSHKIITECVKNAQIGGYARCVMITPLLGGMPSMVVLLQCTCNRFDHRPHVEEQWNLVEKFFNEVLAPECSMMLIGNGSDGDARRFKLQLEYMLRNLALAKRYALNHPMVTLFAEIVRQATGTPAIRTLDSSSGWWT
jgi:hypothetical protein